MAVLVTVYCPLTMTAPGKVVVQDAADKTFELFWSEKPVKFVGQVTTTFAPNRFKARIGLAVETMR